MLVLGLGERYRKEREGKEEERFFFDLIAKCRNVYLWERRMFLLSPGNVIIDLGESKDEISLTKYQEGKVKGKGGDMKSEDCDYF